MALDNVLDKMNDLNSKNKSELRKDRIQKELKKLKVFKSKCKRKLTIARLKTMKGFENLTDDIAEKVIEQLEEYTRIILIQMNRLNKLKEQ